MNPHEHDCFEWFMCQTIRKFPGILPSPFWVTLVRQATTSEPAVLHAVLALSCAHQKDGIDDNGPRKAQDYPDALEQFILRQYSSAIGHLQPHFSAKSKGSVRVALVTCLIFIYLESLRGHYKKANAHLQSGLKLLREIQARPSSKGDKVFVLKPCQNFVDACITETFVRLQVQAILLGQASTLDLVFRTIEPESSSVITFVSVDEARQHLDRLSYAIFHLTELSLRKSATQDATFSSFLIEQQRRIQAGLKSWHATYKASQVILQGRITARDKFCYQVLRIYHTLATIVANTCLQPASESIYDSELQGFTSIIIQSVEIWNIVTTTPMDNIIHGCLADMSDAVAEVGWIPPLYYTAIKCRNHRIRLQAVRLLKALPHKEGMWDSMIAASISKAVVEIEERDFYKDFVTEDDFALCSAPTEKDLLLPELPELNRLHEVQIMLPDNPMEKVVMTCKRRLKDGSCEVLVRECEVLPQARVMKPGRTMK
ncbi:hypothetical protein EG329_010897 [Mollisiaceae sp. DMI_Dod_QoI]|nr:hypothetical protein EG329_010897 [Helotiales sp. DMI_Dod_QoI]